MGRESEDNDFDLNKCMITVFNRRIPSQNGVEKLSICQLG